MSLSDHRAVAPAAAVAAHLSALGAAVLVAIGWITWRRRGPTILLALSIAPSLQLVPVMRWWSPHYLYLPLAFVAMLAAEAIDREGRPRRMIAAWAGAALLGAVTLYDGLLYANDETLWKPEVAAEPRYWHLAFSE